MLVKLENYVGMIRQSKGKLGGAGANKYNLRFATFDLDSVNKDIFPVDIGTARKLTDDFPEDKHPGIKNFYTEKIHGGINKSIPYDLDKA